MRLSPHCARPPMQYFSVAATCRTSLASYKTHGKVKRFMATLAKVRKLLG